MQKTKLFTAVLWIGCAYDTFLGLLGLFHAPRIFDALNVTPPNHWAYIHMIGGFVLCLGILQGMLATSAPRNKQMLLMAILMKFSYCLTVLGHWFGGGIPMPWVWFAFADIVFVILFSTMLFDKGE